MRRDFKRHLDSLGGLYEFSEAVMAERKLPDGVRFPVHLAMEELFVNMVHYNPTITTDIEVTVRPPAYTGLAPERHDTLDLAVPEGFTP